MAGAAILEIAVLALSGFGLVLTVVVWGVVASAVGSRSGNGSDPLRHFNDEKDAGKKDEDKLDEE